MFVFHFFVNWKCHPDRSKDLNHPCQQSFNDLVEWLYKKCIKKTNEMSTLKIIMFQSDELQSKHLINYGHS